MINLLSVLRHLLALTFVSITMTVAGCASASTTEKRVSAQPAGALQVIYVGQFDLGADLIQSDPGTLTGRPRLLNLRQKDPAEEVRRLTELLRRRIVDDLHDAHLSAQASSPNDSHTGWLVTGEFLEVNEGNRMQKAVIGFGAGNSDTRLLVNVRDLSRPAGENLLNLNVQSDGNKSPGGGAVAIETHSPYGMAAKFVLDRNATDKDVRRAADEVSRQLIALAHDSQP